MFEMGNRPVWDSEGVAHTLTYSCQGRHPLLARSEVAQSFVDRLVFAKRKLGFQLHAYVVMPEHVHLLVWSPQIIVADVLRETKASFAFHTIQNWKRTGDARLSLIKLKDGTHRFWLKGGGYDQQMVKPGSILDMTAYIHNNPVRRLLVEDPVDWLWSSAKAYASGSEDGIVDFWTP